ncbi:MAG: redoxin domain-containing protein [Ignavibacteriales bacterium]|nr:redoxin domain-containing protein [Ignavibacteriales bacterium]
MIGKKAPELYEGDWINSSGHKLSDFRGKVVLVEFWTYGCYNCRNTIPAINDWQKKYEGKNFLIIGVHTPEFDREKNLASLRQQVAQLDVQYAVVTDNEYRTWEAYHQQYWPTLYVIDKQGIIRFVQIGEGNYEETERMIQLLIAER